MEKVLIATDKWQVLNNCRADKKDSREVLQGVNISTKYIEATDGRVAIRIDRDQASACNNGAYNVISARKHSQGFTELILEPSEMTSQYPDTDTVFPKDYKKDAGFLLCLEPDKKAPGSMANAVITLFERTKNCYSTVLLARIQGLGEAWQAYNMGQDKAVYLRDTSGTVQALILPFKRD